MSLLRRIGSSAFVHLLVEVTIVFLLALPLNLALMTLIQPFHLASIYRLFLRECLFLFIAFLVLLLAHYGIERRSFAELGYSTRHAWQHLLLGFLAGTGLMSLVVGIMATAGWYQINRLASGSETVGGLLLALVFFFLVGLFEEGLARGIILRLGERAFGTWAALLVSALFFGLAHLMNPHATWLSALAISLEAGILQGAAYLLTRSLWLPIGIHWAWNFFEGPIFGTTVSGTLPLVQPLCVSTTTGPEQWTGGTFGPEAGLVAFFICTVVGIVLLIQVVRLKHTLLPSFRQGDSQRQRGERLPPG